MNCKWWHKIFTTWLGTYHCETRVNLIGSMPKTDYWYSDYKCHVCKLIYRKHILTGEIELLTQPKQEG